MHATVTPDYSVLDPKIVPLVKAINDLGLSTSYSCEGHGDKSGLIQSPYPMVVVVPEPTDDGAMRVLRFIGMFGIWNTNCHDSDDVEWTIMPNGNPSLTFIVRPSRHNAYSLEVLHSGVVAFADALMKMNVWYQPK